MALPPIPPGANPWGKILLWLAETVATGVIWQQFESGTPIEPTPVDVGGPDPDVWMRVAFTFKDTASLDTADSQVFTIDLANITNGTVDSSWTQADFNVCTAAFATFLTAIQPTIAPRLTCVDERFYRMAFNPYSLAEPFAKSGPPAWINNVGMVGSGTGGVASQTCTTITEITASPRNWGRFYLPTLSASSFDSGGRLSNATMDVIAPAVHALYDTLFAAEFYPVVPTTRVGKQNVRTLQVCSNIQIDDVPDVHRSRRLHTVKRRVRLP